MDEEKKILASVQIIDHVKKHPNADRLVIIRVLGYDVIVDPISFGETMYTFEKLTTPIV